MNLLRHVYKIEIENYRYYYSPFKNKFIKTNFAIEDVDLSSKEIDVLKSYKIISDKKEESFIEYELTQLYNNDLLNLVIMPNHDCNFKCSYCYQRKKIEYMDNATVESILNLINKQLFNHRHLHITWFGGEPSLSLDIIEKVNSEAILAARKQGKIFTSSMTTNGYLLNNKNFQKLLGLNVRSFQITIDGIKEIHDKQRVLKNGKGTFERIISNIETMKLSNSNFFNVVIRCNVNKLKTIIDFYNYISQVIDDDKRFSVWFYPICDWPKSSDSELSMVDILREIEKYKINLTKRNMNFGEYCNANNPNSFVIGVHGDIYKCTVHLDDANNKIGYLNDAGDIVLDANIANKWDLLYRYLQLSKNDKILNVGKIMCPYNEYAYQKEILNYCISESNTINLLR